MLLIETFDFRRYAFSEPSIVIDTLRNVTFQHQYKFQFDRPEDITPSQWGKKFSTSPDWKPEGGVKLLKEEREERVMWSSDAMPLCKKGEKVVINVDEMEKALCEVEHGILKAQILFSDAEISWWNAFFQGQREFNSTLLIQDRPLKYPFIWPYSSGEDMGECVPGPIIIDEAEIDLRVFGETREIYVGPYRNPKVMQLEKENMEGDFSDLQLNTFIAVPSENCEARRKFWIAKVEKILSRDENEVPKVISVLWHAVRKGQDPWKGKYIPEVLGFEKKKSKRAKGAQKPIWSIQELDISDTVVFSYNFYLSKSDTLYKKTVDRIEIRLQEYLAEKREKRAKAKQDRLVDPTLPVVESSSSDEEDNDD